MASSGTVERNGKRDRDYVLMTGLGHGDRAADRLHSGHRTQIFHDPSDKGGLFFR